MMTDIYGKLHLTVSDFIVHPEWVEYYNAYRKWIKSLSAHQWGMINAKIIIEKHTHPKQLLLPIFLDYGKPKEPLVDINALRS